MSAPVRSVDVARLAGVSQKTVSRVLNDEPYVSDELRRRVRQAAADLGYRLHHAARTLASGRTHTIGVATLGSALYGPSSILLGVERAARQIGYALRVATTDEGDPAGLARAVESLLGQGVEGIVVSEPIDEGMPVTVRVDVPVLVLGTPPPFPAATVVTAGGEAVQQARAATGHLLDLGHRTVHHLAGPPRWYAARDRLAGWRAALAERGAPEPPSVQGDWSAASGHAAGRLLAADPAVTAVFAANDEMAIGLMRALTEAGRAVPGDVSVVGFDDIPVAAYVSPPLTTIRQSFDAMAAVGLERLVHAIEHGAHPHLPPRSSDEPPIELVVRGSTAPPA